VASHSGSKPWARFSLAARQRHADERLSVNPAHNRHIGRIIAALEIAMTSSFVRLVASMLVLTIMPALAQSDPNKEQHDTLAALYSARWAETVCGFTMNEREHAKLVDAIAFMEGRVPDTPVQRTELDTRAKSFIEQRKTAKDCEPNGEFHKLVRGMLTELPEPRPATPAEPPPAKP
jgi:hypothetical protein